MRTIRGQDVISIGRLRFTDGSAAKLLASLVWLGQLEE